MSAVKKTAPASYDVGYRRPPAHTRFRKGHSGNPSGRRSRVKTIPERVRRALDTNMSVTANGERKAMKCLDVIIRQLTTKAAAGDLKATDLVLRLCAETHHEVPQTIQIVISEDDLEL